MLKLNITCRKRNQKSRVRISHNHGPTPLAGEPTFLITPFASNELSIPAKPLVMSAQSHSKVIGICHRSCGTNGCWNDVPSEKGSGRPDGSRFDPIETGSGEAELAIPFTPPPTCDTIPLAEGMEKLNEE